jgi:7,8-dihydropterin-6-yl-methyl-4-(beta-D-ribofuranosyl)aminobenzene 5'-phosphate synthase
MASGLLSLSKVLTANGGLIRGQARTLALTVVPSFGNVRRSAGREAHWVRCLSGASCRDTSRGWANVRRWEAAELVLLTCALVALAGCGSTNDVLDEDSSGSSDERQSAGKDEVVITIICDNNPGGRNLAPAWGFACVVQGLGKTILFDTGGDGGVLLSNMQALGFDPNEIDAVVISHAHGDHTGGLVSFLDRRGGVPVYIPGGLGGALDQPIRSHGGGPLEAEESTEICPGARTTGTLDLGAIPEHGLCVHTAEGWVLITGCAHPGVANLAAQAKEITGGPIALVVGGFHMGGHSARQVKAVIDRFEQLGVKRVAPCHCTGDAARTIFKQHYGDDCTLAGVGEVFRLKRAQ